MGFENIKIETDDIQFLKELTGEKTSQRAVEAAILYFRRHAKQKNILSVLRKIGFEKGFDTLKSRHHGR